MILKWIENVKNNYFLLIIFHLRPFQASYLFDAYQNLWRGQLEMNETATPF